MGPDACLTGEGQHSQPPTPQETACPLPQDLIPRQPRGSLPGEQGPGSGVMGVREFLCQAHAQ